MTLKSDWLKTTPEELELLSLEQELALFGRDYNSKIGPLSLQLDELQADLADIRAKKHPHVPVLRERAEEARAQAEETIIGSNLGLSQDRN